MVGAPLRSDEAASTVDCGRGAESSLAHGTGGRYGSHVVRVNHHVSSVLRPLEAMTSQSGWEIDDTGPAVAQPVGNSRSRLLVQYLPEPGRPPASAASTARRRNHQDVRTFARAKAIRYPQIGDVSHQIAKLGKLRLVVDTWVLLCRAAAAPPAHGDAGSGSVQRHSAGPPRCGCDADCSSALSNRQHTRQR